MRLCAAVQETVWPCISEYLCICVHVCVTISVNVYVCRICVHVSLYMGGCMCSVYMCVRSCGVVKMYVCEHVCVSGILCVNVCT